MRLLARVPVFRVLARVPLCGCLREGSSSGDCLSVSGLIHTRAHRGSVSHNGARFMVQAARPLHVRWAVCRDLEQVLDEVALWELFVEQLHLLCRVKAYSESVGDIFAIGTQTGVNYAVYRSALRQD